MELIERVHHFDWILLIFQTDSLYLDFNGASKKFSCLIPVSLYLDIFPKEFEDVDVRRSPRGLSHLHKGVLLANSVPIGFHPNC